MTARRSDATRGLFITLEGIDGSGKTTQAALLVEYLEDLGIPTVSVREPGGTAISERIRRLLLDPSNASMAPECELLLYEASRAQLVREVILPSLEQGKVVVCDRFYDSTYAYQAAGRGLASDLVEECNRLGSCGLVPDRTVVFDIEPEVAYARATRDGADRLEGEGLRFQEHVREGYLELAHANPERIRPIAASGTVDEVSTRLENALMDLIPQLGAGVSE